MNKILCLHGALASASSFKKLKEAAGESLQIELYEFSGHGQNSALGDKFSTARFAEETAEWIKNSGLGKVSIFGHSLGGYVGLYLAATEPELVDRVFTFGTKMQWTPEFAAKETAMLDPVAIKAQNPKLQSYLSASHQNWEELCRKVASYMSDLGKQPQVDDQVLASVQCPVRFSVGDRDHMVSIEETFSSYKKLSNGSMQVFPNTQHAVERLNPKYFLESVFDFLQA